MPVHDWTRVSDGTFHDFPYSWVLQSKPPDAGNNSANEKSPPCMPRAAEDTIAS